MSHTGYADDCSDDQCELEEQLNLNSPRLLKACKKQGIEPHELLKKSIVDIREMYKRDNLNKTGIMLAAQHYEERRLEKLRIVMKERTRMLDEEEDWAYVPYNQKRSDLHMAKGRTTEYAPKNDEAKRRKERKQLGEMLIDQQAEMDRFIQEGGDPFAGMGDYQRRLAHTRAKEAQLERKQVDDNDIEVIGDGEYQYDAIGNQGIQLLKRKGEKQKMTGQQKRNKQKLVYKREIEHFNKNEKATREREKKAREYTLRKKTEGMLLENRVIYAHPHRREKMSIKEKAMKDYLVEQLKMQEEDDRRIRRDKETVVQVAKRESKKWFDRQQLDIKKGMGVYEERTKEFGPNFRKAVKAAQRDPAMYSRLIQNSLFEPKDKPEKFKHDYNSDDSVSARGDDEWEDVGYAKGRSPVGGASMMTTKSSWNRLGGENRKSIYDVTGWKKLTEIEAIGNRVKQAGMQSSVSSEFVKRSPQERRQPVKVTYDAEESGDDAWEEDAYKGFKSPGKSTASKSNWSQTRSPERRDKTIYEVTGWKRINEPDTAKKSKLKTGHSSITSEFVRNTPAEIKEKEKHYDGDETDSDWEINLNRAASTKGFASQQSSPNKQYYGKTIYDITGWKKLDDGEVPARGSYKNGQSSISARFVENEGDFLRKPSFKPAPDRFGRNKFDEETEELEKVHLDRAIKVAQLEKEHELKSLKQYEKEWEVQRGVTFGAFDKKEKRYVEKLLDTKRSMEKYQLHEMLG